LNIKKWVIVFLLLLLASTGYLIYQTVEYGRHEREISEMQQNKAQVQDEGQGKEDLYVLPEFRMIYEKNKEFAGWIKIPGTMVDYPVMKPSDDNNYYLDHSPEGEKSKYGAIFLDKATDLTNKKSNAILYGHYFRDGSMFGTLENYKAESYWKEHPYILFDTVYEKGTYEIIAVFLSQVYHKDETVFKYYQFTDITTKDQFEYYIRNIKELELYDTGKTAQYGDSLITLSTCDYWTQNGRLAVVAKKIIE
jgi:sortase, SrtB family